MDTSEFWSKFWSGFAEDPENIPDIENLIFQDKRGVWKTVFVEPNSSRFILVSVNFNPWTGEPLPERSAAGRGGATL